MLESLVYVRLNARLHLVLLRAIARRNPQRLLKVRTHGLKERESDASVRPSLAHKTECHDHLCGERLKRSSFHGVDRQLVVRVNGRKTTRN